MAVAGEGRGAGAGLGRDVRSAGRVGVGLGSLLSTGSLPPTKAETHLLLVFLIDGADVVVRAGTQVHKVGLEPEATALALGQRGGRHLIALFGHRGFHTCAVGGSPPLDLLLADQLFLGRQIEGRGGGIDELGELVAGLWKGVLDDARGLVSEEPIRLGQAACRDGILLATAGGTHHRFPS